MKKCFSISLHRKDEKGAAIVEAAIVLNLWVLLFLGIAEVALLGQSYMILTSAAREGVRVATSMKTFPVGTQNNLQKATNAKNDYMLCINSDFTLDAPDYPFPQCPTLISHYKVIQVLEADQDEARIGDLTTIDIETSRTDNRLKLTITAPHKPLFSVIPGLENLTIGATESGILMYP